MPWKEDGRDIAAEPYRIFSSLRTTGSMMIRHLPWYLDRNHLPEDERYYMEHADSSSTLAASYAEGSAD